MAKKLVIFDLDGTLLNTITDLAMATNQALEQLGFPTYSEEAYKIFVGNGIDILFERALPETERNAEHILKMRALFLGSVSKPGDYAKIWDNLKRKKALSFTPLS